MFVLDASALAKVVLDEPHAVELQDWLQARITEGARFLAPSVLPYELSYALWRRVPPNAVDEPDWTRDIVRDILVGVTLDHDAWARIDPYRGRLSAYDAAYVALAVAQGASLVTYDKRQAAVARSQVPVVSPGA